LIGAFGGAAAAWPLAARAQQPDASGGISEQQFALRAYGGRLPAGLKGSRCVEGLNVAIEFRWAENDLSRLPMLAADFEQFGTQTRWLAFLAITEF
jgi:putative tryptophan/tyrosine transport system substrate-binding protein